MSRLRYLAFFLPQFHPIPENDRWWGRGFTEWHQVTKTHPRFPGHQQPHLPADLGYYDLRVPETRAHQAELALGHGIHGFVWYHYWFGGRRILDRPFEEVLRSGEPGLPFALCWANHAWTRNWNAWNGELLLDQPHSHEDDLRHIRWLSDALADPRAITVDGRPLLLVSHAPRLPDPKRTTDIWRHEATRLGLPEPYLARVDIDPTEVDPREMGFDAAVDFPPTGRDLPPRLTAGRLTSRRVRRAFQDNRIVSYDDVVATWSARMPAPGSHRFPGVTPRWDNSARRRTWALTLHGSTPTKYRRWLQAVEDGFEPPSPDENLVFVNAWNEWAEGAHLEPCTRWGLEYLRAHLGVHAAAQS